MLDTKEFSNQLLTVSEFCHFLASSIKMIQHNHQHNILSQDISGKDITNDISNNISEQALPLWIYSNSVSMNKIFEQKEKIPKNDFFVFKEIFELLNSFPRVMYHLLPFTHDYSAEIAAKEEKKKSLHQDIESLDSLMERIQNGVLGKEKNKCVGKIIRHELRKYKTLLSRDLNEVEKQDIIAQTTAELHGTVKSNKVSM